MEKIGKVNKKDHITGSGYSPYQAHFYPITREWSSGDLLEILFPVEINTHTAHPKVRANRNKIALSRGPLVYCFESVDNPSIPIPNATIDLSQKIQYEFDQKLLGGVVKLLSKDIDGNSLIAIPYYSWANRDSSKMQIWIKKV